MTCILFQVTFFMFLVNYNNPSAHKPTSGSYNNNNKTFYLKAPFRALKDTVQ